MKLKYITLVAFVVFVGAVVGLALIPQDANNNFLDKFSGQLGKDNLNQLSGDNTTSNLPGQNPTPNIKNEVNNTPTKPLSQPTTKSVVLSLDEISKHNSRTSCYLVIKNAVYDVTKFIDKHPGGANKILQMCGGEATKVFSAIHSNFAWNLLKDFFIGNVGDSISVAINNTSNTQSGVQKTGTKTTSNVGYDDDAYEDD